MKNKNIIVDFILCLFFGYFGVHKFYEGKNGLGILYLCTLGLFGIGWLIDVVVLFIKVLNFYNKPTVEDNSNYNNTITTQKNKNIDLNNCTQDSKEKSLIKKHSYSKFDFINDDKVLKYSYYNITVKGVEHRSFDINTINVDLPVSFEFEPENEYDNNAIKVICNDIFIGYIPKNNLQEMIKTFTIRKNRDIKSFISMVDKEKKLIQIAIGFYQHIESNDTFDSLEHIDTTLIKTTKKDSFDVSRQDNLFNMSENDELDIDYQYDTGTYLVVDDCGNELGEINKSVSEKLQDYEDGGKSFYVFVKNLDNSDIDKTNCKIRIFII